MRLIFLTPSLPYPPRRGFELVPYHRIRLLSRQHQITLAYVDDGSTKPEHVDHMRLFCDEVVALPISKVNRLVGVITSVFSGIPLQVGLFRHRRSAQLIRDLCARKRFDILHAYMLRVGELIPSNGLPVVLDLIDSMSVNFERRIPFALWPMRLLLREEVRRLKRYEPAVASRHPHIFVSEIDRDAVGQNGSVIPLGVDTAVFFPGKERGETMSVVFTGNMFYAPNQQAVAWFLEHCWTQLRAQFPRMSFHVVGNEPPSWLRAKDGIDGIHVLGSVPSMADEIRRAVVAIAPMQSGSGMQFKILEAMACGIPVVASTLGLGAIKGIPEQSILLADNPDATIKAISAIVLDQQLADRIGRAGLAVVQEFYTWESHCAALEHIYERSVVKNP